MKKLEISQMENLQGAWGKREWCLTSYMLAAGGGYVFNCGSRHSFSCCSNGSWRHVLLNNLESVFD